MTKSMNEQLTDLKGFTFDGDTGRTLNDLYEVIGTKDCTRDAPFLAPQWSGGNERPSVVNSFLDSEGNRFHIVWHSDESGLSRVVDVILNAPSLARESAECSCDGCSGSCGIPPYFGENN